MGVDKKGICSVRCAIESVMVILGFELNVEQTNETTEYLCKNMMLK